MADVVATYSQLVNLLKVVYGPRMVEQVNKKAWLYKLFEKSSRDFGGKYWSFPFPDEAGFGAVGSYNEDEELADAQAESPVECQIQSKKHYATIRCSGFAMAVSKGRAKAFAEVKGNEIKEKTNSLLSNLNRQCYGYGLGVLGVIASDGSNNFIMAEGTNMRWFRKSMKIDVYTTDFASRKNYGDTTTKKQGRKITDVNVGTRTITYDGADMTVVSGDKVVKEDVIINKPTDGKEMMGLEGIVDDGTNVDSFENAARSSYSIWKANVLANGGTLRALSLDLMQQGYDESDIASEGEPDMLVMGHGQRRKYLNLLWYDVRYGPQELKGGFQVLKHNQNDIYVDKDCPLRTIYMLRKAYIQRYVVKGIGFLDEAGVGAERIPKMDIYEILIGGYFNMGAERCNAQTKVVDLEDYG